MSGTASRRWPNTRRTQARPRGQGTGWLAIAGYAGARSRLPAAGAGHVHLRGRPRRRRARPAGPGHQGPHRPRLRGVRADVADLLSPARRRPSPTSRSRLRRAWAESRSCDAQALEAEVGLLSLLSQQRRHQAPRAVAAGRSSCESTRRAGAAGTLRQLEVGRVRLAQAAHRRRHRRHAAGVHSGGAQLAAALEKLFPTSVRVIDGTVRYIDERAGVRHEFGSLELELVANDIGGPLEAKGSFAWRGEKMAFVGGPVDDTRRAGGAKGPADLQACRTADRGQLRRGARRCLRAGARRTCQPRSHPRCTASASWARRPDGRRAPDPGALSLSSSLAGRRRPRVAVAA